MYVLVHNVRERDFRQASTFQRKAADGPYITHILLTIDIVTWLKQAADKSGKGSPKPAAMRR